MDYFLFCLLIPYLWKIVYLGIGNDENKKTLEFDDFTIKANLGWKINTTS
jgi:hypothetical protein